MNKVVVWHDENGFLVDTCAGGVWTGPEAKDWPNARVWKAAKTWNSAGEALAEVGATDVAPIAECLPIELDVTEQDVGG